MIPEKVPQRIGAAIPAVLPDDSGPKVGTVRVLSLHLGSGGSGMGTQFYLKIRRKSDEHEIASVYELVSDFSDGPNIDVYCPVPTQQYAAQTLAATLSTDLGPGSAWKAMTVSYGSGSDTFSMTIADGWEWVTLGPHVYYPSDMSFTLV